MNNFHVDMPASVNVFGQNKVERQLSVAVHATAEARQALINSKGKLGQAVREGFATAGLVRCAEAASKGNYRPAAEYFAAKMGQPFVISTRASFDALPDLFQTMILRAKMAKNGGYIVTKKGVTVMSGPHKQAVELLADAELLIAEKDRIFAARLAEHPATEAEADSAPRTNGSRKPAAEQRAQ